MRIVEATADSKVLLDSICHLVSQLNPDSRAPGHEQIERILFTPSSTLLLALNEDDHVVGMATLVLFPVITGVRAILEDLVVDLKQRRTGVATALVQEIIRRAKSADAHALCLTSGDKRGAAMRLYRKLGFRTPTTNLYCLSLEV